MRLLSHEDGDQLYISRDLAEDEIEPYAILSHTWGRDEDEVIFSEVRMRSGKSKIGYKKIELCGQQARQDGLKHFWVDTCCIDKTNHTELSTAITSMYRWYQHAQICYVYLSDVPSRRSNQNQPQDCSWESSFRHSRWFTRGWTLQELLAPREVVFYSRGWERLGTRADLEDIIHDVTSIPTSALNGKSLLDYSVIERMRWTHGRQTKKKEDQAYCLLGIFGVYMYLNYGEGDNAFQRLEKEIIAQSSSTRNTGVFSTSLNTRSDIKPLGLCLTSAPHIQPRLFIGRAAEVRRIFDILGPDEAKQEQQRVVLGGIGGVGKTQLAIDYARQHRSSYTSVLWLNATSEQTLHASFQSIAEQLLPINELETLRQEQVLMRVRGWLSLPDNARWLLIFDNYDHPDQYDLGRYCPQASHGSIIITTRLPDEVDGEIVRIRPLTEINDSLDILESRSRRKDVKNDTGARALAKRLDGLPIALVTAGSYLCNNDATFQEYLDAYEARWLVGRQPVSPREYQDRTLYTTWNLTYNHLKTNDPEAASMLKLLAYFDPQEMWFELFKAGLPESPSLSLPSSLADRIDFSDLMGTLVKYGMLEVHHIDHSYRIYSMHTCVHDWTLGALNQQVDPSSYYYALDCVAANISEEDDEEALGRIQYNRISRHAARLTQHRFDLHGSLSSGLSTRFENIARIARLLKEQMQHFAAERMSTQSLTELEKALGPEHRLTVQAMNNLGVLYKEQDKLAEAEQIFERALFTAETAFGPDHKLVIDTINNLGLLFGDQDRLAEAELLLTRALSWYEQHLGSDHMQTLTLSVDIGLLYYDQDKLEACEQTLKLALTACEQKNMMDHPLTTAVISGIGILYDRQHRPFEAEKMNLQALIAYEKNFGPDHISTLAAVHNHGCNLHTQGRHEEAEQMFKRALVGTEVILGANHTSTLTSVHCLSNVYHDQGRLREAEQLGTKALTGFEKAVGKLHSSTLAVVCSLGDIYKAQGKLAEAKQMYSEALAGYTTTHGLDHHRTQDVLYDLKQLHNSEIWLESDIDTLRYPGVNSSMESMPSPAAMTEVTESMSNLPLDV